MRRTSFIFGLFCLLLSCSKSDSFLNCDCSYYLDLGDPTVNCPLQICQSDTCQTYLDIWKQLVIEKNHMSQNYFDNHISQCAAYLKIGQEVISFRINYKITIDWMEVVLWDELVIWLSPSTAGLYPSLALPRNSLFSKNQINSALSIMAFNSRMNTISSIDHLNYHSLYDAKLALNKGSNTINLCKYEFKYDRPHMVLIPSGDPYLVGNGILNWNDNKCISSQINLRTGEVVVSRGVCYIID